MSTSYYLYTEVYTDGKWICINPAFEKDGQRHLATTYESESRSYFGQTAEKIENIGGTLRFDEMSLELQSFYEDCRNSTDLRILFAEIDTISRCLPSGQAHEWHGIVRKDDVFAYESGDLDDLRYESISPEEYATLDEMSKQVYQYYEWDDPMGWFVHFKEILEHVCWQRYDWLNVYSRGEVDRCRVVVLVF